ncbi:GATA zinc finger domain-containing protein 14-like isoform X4 [Pieris brassicae]|uniref:GATA zinc finger domain-containing protein 14-like isoform X4 n=1 Tax=Pieris brassicae TaxID=7116 RepID=UPI001E6615E6|nr:GATA zinc finger domain-containing protein 14-like isoform X4 [Pieris brassicae]
MFLPIYTLAAIANIVAKSHNYNIDHELNPNLRVKKSISDVKVNDLERLYPVESDQSDDYEPNRNSAINKENQLKYSTPNRPDELNVKAQSREKRSYYVPISRPIEGSSTSIPTITKDVSSTSDLNDLEPTTTTTDSSYSDYSVDYENDGNFIFKNQPEDINKNKTDKYPNDGLNNSTRNNTQAYYPLSHTFIPGYNKPKDVFNFEKGPVYTNSTESNTNTEQKNEELLTKKNSVNDKSNERIKRSYYIAKPQIGRPGNAQAYYPLSHTYIPGYNTQDVFDFDQGQVLPISNNKTSDTSNKSKETEPKEKQDSHKKDDRTQGTTTKHNLVRMTRTPQWKENHDYVDYTQLQSKNKGAPHKESQNPTNLDYDNGGEFIVNRPKHANRVKPKQKRPGRPKQTNTPHTDAYGNGYDNIAHQNNPYNENRNNYNTPHNGYNGQYQAYQQQYPANRGFTPYQNGYQYPPNDNYNQRSYQTNYNDINNSYYQITTTNVNSLPHNITENKVGTEQNVTDGIEEHEEISHERIVAGICFTCRINRCPLNYKKIGPKCVRIR